MNKPTLRTAFRRRRRSRGAVVVVEPSAVLDDLAHVLDPSNLTDEQFVEAARTLHTLDQAGTGLTVRGMSTQAIVDMVAKISNSQLDALCADPVLRPFLLDEVFRRMADHLIEEKARDLMFVVTWRFPRFGAKGYDVFQTIFDRGTCLSGSDMAREADTTITIPLPSFVRLATGTAAVATMFVRGRVRIKGDYAIAATLTSYFDMPKPRF